MEQHGHFQNYLTVQHIPATPHEWDNGQKRQSYYRERDKETQTDSKWEKPSHCVHMRRTHLASCRRCVCVRATKKNRNINISICTFPAPRKVAR